MRNDDLEWELGRLIEEDEISTLLKRTFRQRVRSSFGRSSALHRPSQVIVKNLRHAPRSTTEVRNIARYISRARPSDRKGHDAYPEVYDKHLQPVTWSQIDQMLDTWPLQVWERTSPRVRLLRYAESNPEWVCRLEQLLRDESPQPVCAALRESGVPWGTHSNGQRLAWDVVKDWNAGVRASDLRPQDTHTRVLAWHLIFSIPIRGEPQERAFKFVMWQTLSETFGMWGHEYIFAIHKEHGAKIHAHVLVTNRNEDSEPLRFDKTGLLLDQLRQSLAEAAGQLGFDVEATRHADRPEIVEALINGEGTLDTLVYRSSGRRVGAGGTPNGRKNRMSTGPGDGLSRRIAVCAPQWLNRFGEGYLRRRRGSPDPVMMDATHCPPEYTQLHAWLRSEQLFIDDDKRDWTTNAVLRFHLMRFEEISRRMQKKTQQRKGRTLAEWLMVHHPWVFAPVYPGRKANENRMRARFRQLPPIEVVPISQPSSVHTGKSLTQGALQPVDHEMQFRQDIRKVARHLNTLGILLERYGKVYVPRVLKRLYDTAELVNRAEPLFLEETTQKNGDKSTIKISHIKNKIKKFIHFHGKRGMSR